MNKFIVVIYLFLLCVGCAHHPSGPTKIAVVEIIEQNGESRSFDIIKSTQGISGQWWFVTPEGTEIYYSGSGSVLIRQKDF